MKREAVGFFVHLSLLMRGRKDCVTLSVNALCDDFLQSVHFCNRYMWTPNKDRGFPWSSLEGSRIVSHHQSCRAIHLCETSGFRGRWVAFSLFSLFFKSLFFISDFIPLLAYLSLNIFFFVCFFYTFISFHWFSETRFFTAGIWNIYSEIWRNWLTKQQKKYLYLHHGCPLYLIISLFLYISFFLSLLLRSFINLVLPSVFLSVQVLTICSN